MTKNFTKTWWFQILELPIIYLISAFKIVQIIPMFIIAECNSIKSKLKEFK